MRRVGIIGASIGLAGALALRADMFSRRIYGAENIRQYLQRRKGHHSSSGSIATGNRHGGAHEHKREIARYQRQEAARLAKYAQAASERRCWKLPPQGGQVFCGLDVAA